MRAKQFISPLDLPKESKVKDFEAQFEHPIVDVDLKTGIDTGCGLDEAWERNQKREHMVFPSAEEILRKSKKLVKVKVSDRKWGHVCVDEVWAAWEASGHHRGRAAKIMKVHENTYSNWLKKFFPAECGDARHHVPKEEGDGHNQR